MDTESHTISLSTNGHSIIKPISSIPQFALVHSATNASGIYVKPGDKHFIRWFVIASYFPLITACLGPLSNMISIAALVERWRENEEGVSIPDKPWIIALNGISLFLGCSANVSLLLNFSNRLNYKLAQFMSILGWMLSSGLLFSVVIAAEETYYRDSNIRRSLGFWYAVLTVIMYFLCLLLSCINYIGYLLNKYPATFNLDSAQRGVMIHTLMLSVWLAIGGAMFCKLIHQSYGNALYFCVVSLLTVGLGDIIPRSVAAKIVSLVYSLIGLLELGLIVSMLRSLILSSGGPTLFWNKLEKDRSKMYNKLVSKNKHLSDEKCFELIRSIRHGSKMHQKHASFLITIFVFLVFWLIGALVFHYAEKWDYFDSVYFCFLCLLTIGYGDFAPKSNAGRVFFVVWALSAVPLMTILISNLGDYLYTLAYGVDDIISKLVGIFPKVKSRNLSDLQNYLTHNDFMGQNVDHLINEIDMSDASEASSNIRSTEDILNDEDNNEETSVNLGGVVSGTDSPGISKELERNGMPDNGNRPDTAVKFAEEPSSSKLAQNKHMQFSMKIVSLLKRLMMDSVKSPDKHYSVQEWYELIDLIDPDGNFKKDEKNNLYWISDRSPLKYPIRESNYITYKLFEALEARFQQLLEDDTTNGEELNREEGEQTEVMYNPKEENSRHRTETQNIY